VTGIETNRRGDVILGFGCPKEAFKAIIPASCDLSKDHEWISSLRHRRMIVAGLISFYALKPAMRISEKEQVSLGGLKGGADKTHLKEPVRTRPSRNLASINLN
jgi:hypothetical protein